MKSTKPKKHKILCPFCGHPTSVMADENAVSDKPIYKVENGLIEIDGKPYPIKIKDGCYLIRKLSPVECERLQTMPDNYTAGVSDGQRCRQLGNGWTADVIAHILGGLT